MFELGISHIEISIHILIFIHRSQGDRLYRSSDKVLKVHQVPGYPSVERSFDVTIIQISLSSIQLCPGILKIRYRRMVIRFGLDEVDLTDSPARHRFFHLLVLCPGVSQTCLCTLHFGLCRFQLILIGLRFDDKQQLACFYRHSRDIIHLFQESRYPGHQIHRLHGFQISRILIRIHDIVLGRSVH